MMAQSLYKHFFFKLLLLHHTTVIICDSQWIPSSTSVLPRADDSIAVGLYNHSVYLLGGASNKLQLVEYEILSDNFIDHGASRFNPIDVWGGSDFYTQIDTILYMISKTGDALLSYNMKTDEFNDNFHTIPSTVGDFGCLISRVGYLYVVGGYDYTADINLNTLQVLDLATNNWMNNVDTMQESRVGHTCVVDPSGNTLYAISGYTWNSKNYQNTYTATIEIIDTNDIAQNSWSYITGQLSIGLGYIRSVIHMHNIYVIGGAYGRDSYNWELVDIVHIIDTNTGSVSISNDLLPFSVSSVAPVIVSNILYAFGGYTGSGIDSWMMYILPQSTTTTAALTTTSNPTTTTSEATFPLSTKLETTTITSTAKTTASDTTSPVATTLETTTAAATTSIVSETTAAATTSIVLFLRTTFTETVSDFETASKAMDASIVLVIACGSGVFLGIVMFGLWKLSKMNSGDTLEREPGARDARISPSGPPPPVLKLQSVSVDIANDHGVNQKEKGNDQSVTLSVSDSGNESIYEHDGPNETAGGENVAAVVDGNGLDNNHTTGGENDNHHMAEDIMTTARGDDLSDDQAHGDADLPPLPPPCNSLSQNDHVLQTPGDF